MSATAPKRPAKPRRPRKRPGYEVVVIDTSPTPEDPAVADAVLGAWLSTLPPG
jgi:hypothetical protein